MNFCSVCKTNEASGKPGTACNICHAERTRIWKLKNPEKTKLSNKKQDLKKRYNITIDQYNQLFNKQNGLCAGCDIHVSQLKRSLCVDHDHKTGKIRGLLCDDCNVGLGRLRDERDTLLKLASYLERYFSESADQTDVDNIVVFKRKSLA